MKQIKVYTIAKPTINDEHKFIYLIDYSKSTFSDDISKAKLYKNKNIAEKSFYERKSQDAFVMRKARIICYQMIEFEE